MTGGIIFGTLLAMMRLSAFKPLSMLAGGYVNLMRSVPLVLVIFWFFFLVPYIGAWITGASQPIKVGAFMSAVITFTMFEAAYYCEIMRAGIQSIARGQVWSGYALGLNYWQTMGTIVLPQAFRNMLPVLLTQTIILFQDTSLVYVISATDFLGAAAKVANRDYRLVEMYTFVAVVYFIISYSPVARWSSTSRTGSPSSDDLDQERQQVVRHLPGADRLHHRGRQGRGGRGLRALGQRQVDAHQVRQRARAVPEGRDHASTASRSATRRPTCRSCARASAWCSRTSSCSRT